MNERTYPYTAWVLPQRFKPKQVVMKEVYDSWDSDVDYGDLSDAGTLYPLDKIFDSLSAAISGGRAMLDKQRLDLDKKLANLAKKHAALDKAEKEATA